MKKLRDYLGAETVEHFANRLGNGRSKAMLDFKAVAPTLTGKKFLERRDVIAKALPSLLPESFCEAITTLNSILPAPRVSGGYGTWADSWILVCTRYVSLFGLDHTIESLAALRHMTSRFTGEFDVRPFLETQPQLTMRVVRSWCRDDCLHVRRLAVESIRPLLPWAPRIRCFGDNWQPILKIADKLVDDPAKYVQRSVANLAADIYKLDADLAIKQLETWLEEPTEMRKWIVRHAIRYPKRMSHQCISHLVDAVY